MSAPASSTIRAASAITAGLGAEDLHRERMLVGGDPQVAERALVPVVRGPAQLTISEQTRPGAVAASLAAERLHAHAGHRGEHEPRRDLDVPIRQELAKIYLHRAGNSSRQAV